MKFHTASADETRALAARLAPHLQAGDVVVLVGDLGSGKTTFAQGVARGLGVEGPVTSPSFTLVQQYEGRLPVAHVDVYRLDRIQELHDLGFEELVDGAGVTLVEWGDAVAQAMPNCGPSPFPPNSAAAGVSKPSSSAQSGVKNRSASPTSQPACSTWNSPRR